MAIKLQEIMQLLEKENPLHYAMAWDNSGLQVGNREQEIKKIFVALDATDKVIEEAIENEVDLILTHHPLIFQPLKKISTDNFIAKRVIKCIENNISIYSMHTNYDVCNMARLGGEYLQLNNMRVLDITHQKENGKEEGLGRVGELPETMTLKECAEHVKACFQLPAVQVFGDLASVVQLAAVSPGSGKTLIEPALKARAQVLITGDIGYNDGIDAVARGMQIIDAGHYGLEHIFIHHMKAELEKWFQEITIMEEMIQQPMQII